MTGPPGPYGVRAKKKNAVLFWQVNVGSPWIVCVAKRFHCMGRPKDNPDSGQYNRLRVYNSSTNCRQPFTMFMITSVVASASHLRSFTSQILTSQAFISYIFISADRHISDLHVLYFFICITSVHLRISDLYIFTFIFRFSYFETTFCLHIFGCSSLNHTVLFYHLQDFIVLYLQFGIFTSSKLYIFKHNLLALGPTV